MPVNNIDSAETNLFPNWAVEIGSGLRSIAETICKYVTMFFCWLASWFEEDSAPPTEAHVKTMTEYTELGNQIALAAKYTSWKTTKTIWSFFGCENPLQAVVEEWNKASKDPFQFLETAAKNPEYKEKLKKFLFIDGKIDDFMYGVTIDEIQINGFSASMQNYVNEHKKELSSIKKKFISKTLPENEINTIFARKDWQKLVERTINTRSTSMAP